MAKMKLGDFGGPCKALAGSLRIDGPELFQVGFERAGAILHCLEIEHGGFDIAGANGVHANAVRRQFQRQGLGEQHHTSLGGAVDGSPALPMRPASEAILMICPSVLANSGMA